jgi:hypothetical protein
MLDSVPSTDFGGGAIETFVRRDDAERFIEEVLSWRGEGCCEFC